MNVPDEPSENIAVFTAEEEPGENIPSAVNSFFIAVSKEVCSSYHFLLDCCEGFFAEDLKAAIIRAINETYGERDELLHELTETLEKALLSGNKAEIDELTKQMKKLQKQIVSLTDEAEQERVGEEIRSIREKINELRSTDDDYDEEQKRLEEMIAFLKSEGTAIREYDDSLVRKFIDCIMVYDYSITIGFKTGKEISMRV